MKRRLAIFAGLFLLVGSINAQVVQKGVVLKYNGKQEKTPLEGVSLVVRGTGSTTSEKGTGSFSLSFNTLKAGDRLSFRDNTPALNGYEVYNKETVETWNISPSQPFEVVMVDSEYFNNMKGELKKNTRAYYEEELNRTKNELAEALNKNKIQKEEYDRKILEAEDEFYEKLKNIDNYIDQFVRIDLSTIKPAEQHILDLVSQGKFDEAIKAYEDLQLIDKYEQAAKNRNDKLEAAAKLQESAGQDSQQMDSLYQSLKNQVKTYQLAGGKENFDKAGSILKRIALSDTTNYIALATYTDFCLEQNDYQEAEIYAKRCMNLLQTSNEDIDQLYSLSGCQNNLALIYMETQRYAESEKMYKLALQNLERLASINPDAFEPELVFTQMNLAILYTQTRRYDEGKKMFKSVLAVYERLAKDNPAVYEPFVAKTQMNLAVLCMETQCFGESEILYKSALEINQRLVKSNPDAYEPSLANTQMNLGNLYCQTQRYAEGETMLKSALEIYERLSKVNPDAFESDLASVHMNLGSLFLFTQRFVESEMEYKSALEIYLRLAGSNPDIYELEIAKTHINLGNLYYQTQRFAESETMYQAALSISEQFADSNPAVSKGNQLYCRYWLGLTQISEGKLQEAIASFEHSLSLAKQHLQIGMGVQEYLGSLNYLSLLMAAIKEYEAAYNYNKELLPVLAMNYESNSVNWGRQYYVALVSQSYYSNLLGRFEEGEHYSREALKVDPDDHLAYTNLAVALLFQGKVEEAEKIYRQYKSEFKDGFLEDFVEYERVGVIPEERKADVERIKAMLTEE